MKNFKLRFWLFLSLIVITLVYCLLFPLAIILIILAPKQFQGFLLKIVNTINLLDWLQKIAIKHNEKI